MLGVKSATSRNKTRSFETVVHVQERTHDVHESPPHKWFLVGCSSPLMRLADTPHDASSFVHARSAWSVKTKRAPSQHGRHARVYGHSTTAMHEMSTPFPPRPPPPAPTVARLFNIIGIANDGVTGLVRAGTIRSLPLYRQLAHTPSVHNLMAIAYVSKSRITESVDLTVIFFGNE